MINHFEITNKAIQFALEAGEILKSAYGKNHEVRSKEGIHNLVTESDAASEACLIRSIKNSFPDHTILSEEIGLLDAPNSEVMWIIDPLDGTVNFAHHLPIFSISIGVAVNKKVVAAVVYSPILNELFHAQIGQGAYLNGSKLNVSSQTLLDSSFITTGFPYNVNTNPRHCIEDLVAVLSKGLPVRRLGSAALDLSYVAAGRFDGYFEVALKPWDMAAGQLLVEEAQGRVTHYDTTPYNLFSEKDILATNGHIHRALSQVLGVK